MLDAIKPLLDSNLITEETRQEINEAWEAKLNEAREQARAELREEFAQRYEHDKQVMVEALDRMVTEGLNAEIQAVAAEKAQLAKITAKNPNLARLMAANPKVTTESRIAIALKKPVAEMLQMVETKEDVQRIKQFVDDTFIKYGAVNESAFAVRNQILEHVTQAGAQRRREHSQRVAH
jgi:hypothetical protein